MENIYLNRFTNNETSFATIRPRVVRLGSRSAPSDTTWPKGRNLLP